MLGDYLRADHLVENVLKARLVRGTRGLVKDSPKLDQATVDEYNGILAKVISIVLAPYVTCKYIYIYMANQSLLFRSTTTTATGWLS